MIKDVHNILNHDVLVNPAVAKSTVTSSVFDATDALGVKFSVNFGESGDTLSGSVYWNCKIQSSATSDGSFTDLEADDYIVSPSETASTTFGLVNSAADDDDLYSIGVNDNSTDRYFKVVVTATGTHTNGTPIAVTVVSMPNSTPTTDLSTPA